MKRVFVSVPFKGRTDEAIKNSIVQMHKLAEIYFGEKLERIDNFVDTPSFNVKIPSLYCLGQAISKMSEADYFIGVMTFDYHGCIIEKEAAYRYKIPYILIDMEDCSFFKDIIEKTNKKGEIF